MTPVHVLGAGEGMVVAGGADAVEGGVVGLGYVVVSDMMSGFIRLAGARRSSG